MNAIALLYADAALRLANDRMHDRHVESMNDRRAVRRKGGLAATVASLVRAFTTPAPADVATLPRLADYPYR